MTKSDCRRKNILPSKVYAKQLVIRLFGAAWTSYSYYSGLSKFMNLNIWSLTGRIVWKRLRGMVLWKSCVTGDGFEGFKSP